MNTFDNAINFFFGNMLLNLERKFYQTMWKLLNVMWMMLS